MIIDNGLSNNFRSDKCSLEYVEVGHSLIPQSVTNITVESTSFSTLSLDPRRGTEALLQFFTFSLRSEGSKKKRKREKR